ncbi:MAG: ABC transporter permease [Phycisphaerales bacterium]|nr:ABC transporter permease [Phycisphaerales bacterium]
MSSATKQPESVTGVELAQGIGHQPAQGFWAEAFGQVIRRPAAMVGIIWIAIVAFFAIFSPLIASGHPLIMWAINEDGSRGAMSSPMLRMLTLADVILIIWGIWAPVLIFLPIKKLNIGEKLRLIAASGIQLAIGVVLVSVVSSKFGHRDASDWMRDMEQGDSFSWVAAGIIGLIAAIPFTLISIGVYKSKWRVIYVIAVLMLATILGGWKWSPNTSTFFYRSQQTNQEIEATFTIVPFSPNQSETAMYNRSPMSTPLNSMWDRLAEKERLETGQKANLSDEQLAEIIISERSFVTLRGVSGSIDSLLSFQVSELIDELETQSQAGEISTLFDIKQQLLGESAPTHYMGTDTLGQDVLSQMLHACRLSISIGFISTGIAVVIGVTVGALMGYFGGWVDMILYRVVEIFMAIPVLFLLIVAASVLPRNIYFMMAIIGCFTWTGAARFVRAEFMKLRETDYVQAAKAVGLPLWSILFKHMLPNGVTPVLVDSSFAIAAAILIEAILSYLGLGPTGQASWGKLLSNASGETSDFLWWLAIFPGAAIFFTTMAYNLIGEALRDAIDPKLKKARV